MGNVYTGIDIGTNSIKIVVVEKHKNKFNLLASSEKPCSYMKNGEVTNTKGLSTLIKSSKEDIEKLRNAGYSLSLQVNGNGIATVSVLSISKSYEFTDEYFDDGFNQYPYTYKKNKLSITIDDYDIVFEKE